MQQFEYEITSYPLEVLQHHDYFCSPDGECIKETKLEASKSEFQNILNERGRHGWEFVQLIMLDKTIDAIWKKLSI